MTVTVSSVTLTHVIRAFTSAAFLICLLATSVVACGSGDSNSRPNIVVILADDMGYGDVQTLNPASRIPTPHLNALAAGGMRFTDAHTPSAVCTPTRYGLVCGRYCWRTRLKSGVLNGYGSPLIEDQRITIAEFLKDAGYTTGIVGKWHLGLGFAKTNDDEFDFSKPVSNGPHTHGFGHSFVIPASLDFPPYVYIRDGSLTAFPSEQQSKHPFPAFWRQGERSGDFVFEDCLDRLADEASAFVEREAKTKQPFFLYFPLTAPHKPVLPHQRFRGTTELGPYGDFVTQVDHTVGRVLSAIDDAQVADSTVVIYTSDNGSFMHRRDDDDAVDHVDDETIQAFRKDRHTANGPFRGTKADVWEAGHRVPFFVRWPGVVAANTVCAETICITDVFATAAEVAGRDLPADAAVDSFSFVAQLKGQSPAMPRASVVNHSAAGMFAVRQGSWKLVLGNGSGGREAPRGKPFQKPYQLFDLASDVGERNNLIDTHGEIAEKLEVAFQKIRDSGRSRP